MRSSVVVLCTAALLGGQQHAASASLAMPRWFGDNMVLQTNQQSGFRSFLNGQTEANAVVNIVQQKNGDKGVQYTVTSDATGAWEVMLNPTSDGPNDRSTITVSDATGANQIKATNVVFGDVFFCGGQSNMVFPTDMAFNKTVEIASLKDTKHFGRFRFFRVDEQYSSTPQFDVKANPKTLESQWVTAAQALSVLPDGSGALYIDGFSALCYLTVRDVQRLVTSDRAMGLVQSCVGGTRVEAWMDKEAISKSPYTVEKSTEAKNAPSVLYNAMVHPFRKMSIKALLWDQGERNEVCPMEKGVTRDEYYTWMFAHMVQSWRAGKGMGDFATVSMELPPPMAGSSSLAEKQSSLVMEIRSAQQKSLPRPTNFTATTNALDITGVAVSNDLGGFSRWGYVHPPNKNVMASRMALQLARSAYAVQGRMVNNKADAPNVPVNSRYTGPLFKAAAADKTGEIKVTFSEGSYGLHLEDASGLNIDGSVDRCSLCCANGAPFEVLQGGKWNRVPFAHTTLTDGLTTVSLRVNGSVDSLRYAWAAFVDCVLYNGDGLPAGQFVTDVAPAAAPRVQVEKVATPPSPPTGALTRPPMGFNSWNYAHCNVDELTIKEVVDVMVSSGLRDAGYEYVNLDDCWQVERNNVTGEITPDPARFPSGIKALAAYVHSQGMKFGVYTSRTQYTCQGRPGAYEHEALDGATYCKWGVDYLKIDNCGGARFPHANTTWLRFKTAFEECHAQTGRYITESVETCPPGNECAAWIKGAADLWRTTDDLQATWASVMKTIHLNNEMAEVAALGHYNDPDMLQVGSVGLSHDEQVSHMSLWALSSAPLLFGTSVVDMSADTLAILSNTEVLAVNKDGGLNGAVQGKRIKQLTVPCGSGATCQAELWEKKLSDGSQTAVIFLNLDNTHSIDVKASFYELGLRGAQTARDAWQHKDLGTFSDTFTAKAVPPHGVAFVIFKMEESAH